MIKLKKGDDVIVLAGKDKGKKGKIIKMFPKKIKQLCLILIKLKKIKNQIIINLVEL